MTTKTPNPRPLYAIGETYLAAFDTLHELQELGELDEQTVADTLEGIAGEFDEKAVSTGAYIRSLDTEIEKVKEEEKRLNGMRKRLETRQEWLTAYLKKQMELLGKAKIEGLAARLAIRKNAPSVVIDDLGALPAIYVSEEIVYTPLKTDISKDLKNGVAVPGAHLETKTRLEIK